MVRQVSQQVFLRPNTTLNDGNFLVKKSPKTPFIMALLALLWGNGALGEVIVHQDGKAVAQADTQTDSQSSVNVTPPPAEATPTPTVLNTTLPADAPATLVASPTTTGTTGTTGVNNPLELNHLISQAITTHPLIGSARADEQATAEGITAAKLGLFPTPSFSTGYDKTDGAISRLSVRQPLWAGGKLTATVNQAIYDDKAAEAYIAEQQNTVAKNTIDIWQSYIFALASQQLYVKNLQRLDEFESMMNRRVGQGVSARIELDLITNRILQDQNSLQGAQEQQRIAEARLSQIIGQNIPSTAGQNINLDTMAKYAKQQSQALAFEQMAFNQASINNPSVIKQQYQIEAAKQQVKVQQSSRYPTVYAQYENTYYHKDKKNDGQFSLGLSYDPGAGFSNMALARASEAKVQSLVQSQEAARRTVMEDIQTQYQQFVSAKDQENSLIAAVAGAQIVVDSYRRQFIAGRKSWLEVLNAIREQADYQRQLLQVQAQLLASFYKLQVEFGLMPWQQNLANSNQIEEFHPYPAFREWAIQQPENMKTLYHTTSQKLQTLKNEVNSDHRPADTHNIPTADITSEQPN